MRYMNFTFNRNVIPAKAGISFRKWIPASAGMTVLLFFAACSSFEEKIEVVKPNETYRIHTMKNNVELYDYVKENKLCPGFYQTDGRYVEMMPDDGMISPEQLTYNVYTIKCMKD